MDSDWSVATLDGREGVCLVRVDLQNTAPVDRHVAVRNRLEGPVLPPRRGGVPEPGWDRRGFVGVVPAADRRVLGYACPAPIDRPPVSVVTGERATGDGARDDEETRAARAVRELGDPRPPADALSRGEAAPDDGDGADAVATTPPQSVESWLSTVERRIERSERLADGPLDAATAALDATADRGSDVTTLDARLATDVATLRDVAARASSLADRAAAVDVPLAALRRLA